MIELLIDTDAGIDDLLAISFLLTQTNVNIQAITVVNGLAHPHAGAGNILKLLELTDQLDIPVYIGAEKPLPGGTDFPEAWRKTADTLPGVTLPSTSATAKRNAVDYLAGVFSSSNPVTLLALGPQTNLSKALTQNGGKTSGIAQMIMMGGAVYVKGNVAGHGDHKAAEWNIFEDPEAAASVFGAGLSISMVPLDATQYVPIGTSFLQQASGFTSPLGVAVYQLLQLGYTTNNEKYYAWDPLAAVSVVVPTVVSGSSVGIEIVTSPPDVGKTQADDSAPLVQVATSASASAFGSAFLGAFS
jgi:inosine-uridine nucleoside N-ribohydrolase